ncbi:MAG: hypothetical protein AMJ63_01665 [Myxococcales bacterium SG8_38_1]|jgi:hypothetical protein|nr:MAG: hypothetical protein AMJ63_01665 [Myxococcales bacterium SG8_38_1]
MTTTRKIGVAIAVLIALFVAFNIYYFMPRATMASITGTEVKRMDGKDVATGDQKTRDVRFIYATEFDTKKAVVFRNEDNGWYFKFDSGDIAAEATKLAKNEIDEVALIKYYGIRIAVFDSYPNVLSIKEVEPDYVYVPWVNMIILVLMLILFIWLGVKVRKLFRSAKNKITNRPAAS